MPASSSHRDDYYEFAGFRFYPDRRHQLLRLNDSAQFGLRPQQVRLLTLLVRRPRGVVTYAEIQDEVWPDDMSGKDFSHDIVSLKSGLAGRFGRLKDELIETVREQGYRLNADVTFHRAGGNEEGKGLASETTKDQTEDNVRAGAVIDGAVNDTTTGLSPRHMTFRSHLGHVLANSCLFALLHVIALWIELAYRVEDFRGTLWVISPAVFLWCAGTAYIGLFWGWRTASRNGRGGLLSSLSVFTVSGILLYLILGSVLPPEAVTAAGFQTLTAHAAYLKDVFWFQALAVVFLLLPWQEVAAREYERKPDRTAQQAVPGSVVGRWQATTKLAALVLLLILALPASALMSYYLFERLRPGAHMNLFMQLVLWRLILGAIMGLECVMWYARALRDQE